MVIFARRRHHRINERDVVDKIADLTVAQMNRITRISASSNQAKNSRV